MILLDTTVLVYAVGSEHPLKEPCRRIIQSIGAGELAATTTVEAIQEFAHVRARRTDRVGATRLAAHYATLLAPLVTVDEDDLRGGLDIFQSSQSTGAFDAVLAASVIRRPHITALVSADRGFRSIRDLRWLAPADVLA